MAALIAAAATLVAVAAAATRRGLTGSNEPAGGAGYRAGAGDDVPVAG